MNSLIYLVDQKPEVIQSLRKPYENPTKTLRNCSRLRDSAGMDRNARPLTPSRDPALRTPLGSIWP